MSKAIKKVVFYGAGMRSFRTVGIGQLFEIAQKYPVILLAEEFDEQIINILKSKQLFPKLEEIIFVHQHSGPKMNILKKNWHLCNLAKKIIYGYKPDVVVAPRDNYPFDMYLMRFAKKINALNLVFQVSHIADLDDVKKEVDLTNAYLRFPRFFPLSFRLFLAQCRKYVGHFLYYWILPVLAGDLPFPGKSSFVLRQGTSGMRDSDYQIVFSQREYNLCYMAGVPDEKIYLLRHPLERESREFFIKNLIEKQDREYVNNAVTILVPPNELGFRRTDFSLISKKERLETRKEIIGQIAQAFSGWKIFIKPHPDVKNFEEIKDIFESISISVKVVNPKEPMDNYIAASNVVIGLPKANTNALFYTSLLSPEKAILALDFDKELLGDFYKDFEGVEYIDDKRKFIDILNLIAQNSFQKRPKNKETSGPKEFSSATEALEKLFFKKITSAKR